LIDFEEISYSALLLCAHSTRVSFTLILSRVGRLYMQYAVKGLDISYMAGRSRREQDVGQRF